ncbi:MAG: hypothetical protein Q8P61_06260 [Candidatus Nanopelagicales bacterium]|nr:hypothetical protein [Candidatus Nanopelagicales bacterium]
MQIKVTVKGARELARTFGDDGLIDRMLRPGFKKSAVVVEGSARGKVHTVTRKLQGSLGHELQGKGASLEAHIGPQPGLGQSRGYSESDTSRWKKPRRGKNKGDPQTYAPFEEERTRYRPAHPFLEPALTENEGRIEDLILQSVDDAIAGFGR